jgi:transmembrane protein 231
MGIPISAPIVHEDFNKTQFRANSFGAWILEIIALLSVLILPFVIGFSMGRFWVTLNSVVATPDAEYTRKYIAKATALDGTDYLWTSSESLLAMLDGDVRAMNPHFTYFENDVDSDDRPDRYEFNFVFPLRTASPITAFHFVPEFQYSLKTDLFTLNMTSSPYVFLSTTDLTSTGTDGIIVDGHVPFRQAFPIDSSAYTRYDIVYQRSYLDRITDLNDIVDAGNIGRRYASRNQSTPFIIDSKYATNDLSGNVVPTPLPGLSNSLDDLFTVSIRMRIQTARVDYVPSFAESLKDAWIQYFCIAYVIYWAFGIVRSIFVMQALVNTIAEVRGRK